jgi:hypothetical protein
MARRYSIRRRCSIVMGIDYPQLQECSAPIAMGEHLNLLPPYPVHAARERFQRVIQNVRTKRTARILPRPIRAKMGVAT